MIDLRTLTAHEILSLHTDIADELARRKILRSSNNPTGGLAEHLFATTFGWKLETNSNTGYDATDANGTRFEIKCRRMTASNTSRQLSALRNLPSKHFDYLAALLIDSRFKVLKAAFIPHEIVEHYSTYVKHDNKWNFLLKDSIWQINSVRDVTNELRKTEQAL